MDTRSEPEARKQIVPSKDLKFKVKPELDLPRGTETILLVEDDALVHRHVARMLRRIGYTVLAAADGKEAFELFNNHNGELHLLLTDVKLPDMDGKQVANAITAEQPDLKVLFMSGYPAEVIAEHGILDPGILFIEKPFNSMQLASKVRSVLEGH